MTLRMSPTFAWMKGESMNKNETQIKTLIFLMKASFFLSIIKKSKVISKKFSSWPEISEGSVAVPKRPCWLYFCLQAEGLVVY